MKKIRSYIDNLNNRIEQWCESLSPKQRKKTVFIGLGVYILLGIAVVAAEWSELTRKDKKIEIRHIQNPVPAVKNMPEVEKDSLTELNNN